MAKKLCILTGLARGKSYNLESNQVYTVGRSIDNDITIYDKNISRQHIKIQPKEETFLITDLHSQNGTYVGGRNLIPGFETEITEGVPIVIGMTLLGFGEVCESCLKPLLDDAGIYCEEDEDKEDVGQFRITTIKNNLECVYRVENALQESKNINEIIEIVLDNIFLLMTRIDRCVMILLDNETNEISRVLYKSSKPVESSENIYNKDLVEKALMLNKAVVVSDVNDQDNEDEILTQSLRIMKIRSAMCVPWSSCFESRGAIYVDSLDRPNGFRKKDHALLNDICSRAALAIDEKLLNKSIGYNL